MKKRALLTVLDDNPGLARQLGSELARAGLGYTITPERAIIVLGGYDSFNCFLYGDSQDSWDVSAVYSEDVYLDQAERALIGTMKQVFGKE